MSNDPQPRPSDENPAKPASSERTETGEVASSPAETSAEGPEAPRRGIRIGSQRDTVPRPWARTQTEPPAATEAANPPAADEPANPQAAAPAVPAAPPAAAEPAAPSAPELPAPDLADIPAPELETESEPEPGIPAPDFATPSAPEELPVPNRHQLSPELEQELAEALGDLSIDELMAAETTERVSASGELELESRVRGIVLRIHRDDVFVSLGGRSEGIASLRQFATPPEPGVSIEVVIARFDREEGVYELTIPGASVDVEDWSDLSEGMLVETRVTGHNKGGLECEVKNLRGFIPASQVSVYRVEDLEEMVGQKLQCIVTEVNPQQRNLVLSRRAVLEREKDAAREQLLGQLQPGATREGVVRSLRDFGAFVDLGGIDGLIHISKLSWDRVNHPSDVLTEGQTVKVRIDKIDPETGKIGLSYRDLQENPWDTAEQKYAVGTVVSGTVTRLAQFGAFVRLESGIEGLIHISELAHHRVLRTSNVVSEGQEVEVKIVSVDRDAQRIGLSLKAMMAAPESKKKVKPEFELADEDREMPKPIGPLKGGKDGPTGGERFGLNW